MSLLGYSLIAKKINELDNGINHGSVSNENIIGHLTDKEIKALFYDTSRKELYGILNSNIVVSKNGGNTWENHHMSIFDSWSPHRIVKTKRGNILVWLSGDRLLVLDENFNQKAIHIEKGRPLNTTVGFADSGDLIMFCEYAERSSEYGKKVWQSKDGGVTWEVSYEDDEVAHFHGVQFDGFSNSFWITSGDAGSEIKILQTIDDGDTWDLKVSGGQEHRNCGIGFTEKYILWIPDNPSAGDSNAIYRLDRNHIDDDWVEHEEVIYEYVTGASYGCTRTNDGRVLFFTSAETTPYSAVYLSDGDNSEMVLRTYKKYGSTKPLAGFKTVTHIDNDNVGFVEVADTENMDGIFKLRVPFIIS